MATGMRQIEFKMSGGFSEKGFSCSGRVKFEAPRMDPQLEGKDTSNGTMCFQ
jgi:hypothetical protein